MALLVVAEHDNKTLKSSTLNALAAASAIGGETHVLVAGSNARPAAEAAAQAAGVGKVLLAEDPAYEHIVAEDLANLVVKLAPSYSHVLAPASSFGKNFTPRVAALLDVAPRLVTLKVEEPPKRQGGKKVGSVQELVDKLKNEARVI